MPCLSLTPVGPFDESGAWHEIANMRQGSAKSVDCGKQKKGGVR